MRRSEQREHIFKLLFMTQFNSEDEMSDQVSMYFETLGEAGRERSGGNAGRSISIFWNIWKRSTRS